MKMSVKNYYVWQEVKMGILWARTKLHKVDEAEGQAGVRQCSLVDHVPLATEASR
ncbi:hypothetical protein [Bdellovibrio sp. NC01]|uniref:hypothetical protein n=1 Tax=Bdellovibrio sp. NC01 TaxID=2220073 RepID=UPI00143DE300|nr:hypothetical protein [Bdellovibrio sp. NC01]